MKPFRTALVLGVLVAIATIPSRSDPPVTLQGLFDGKVLKFSGTAPAADGAVLSLRVSRLQERLHLGRLEAAWIDAGGSPVVVRNGRFVHEEPVARPGVYRAVVGKTRADVVAWDDDLLRRVLADRAILETGVSQIRRLYEWMGRSIDTELRWDRLGHEVLYEALPLQERAYWLAGPNALYPVAEQELRTAVRMMTSVPPHFFWSADGFAGAFDPATDSWIKGPDGRPFSVEGMIAHLDGVADLIRRECSLWLVHNARRVYGTDPLLAASRLRHPEIGASLEDMEGTLDRIEERLRGAPRPAPAVVFPPTPPRFAPTVLRLRKVREARVLLQEADGLWDKIGDRRAPGLYRTLQTDYRDVLDELQARVRVGNRSRAESE
jgi:hypothetical protein